MSSDPGQPPPVPAQTSSAYPAVAPPFRIRLAQLEPHDCSYLPGRPAQMQGVYANVAAPDAAEALLNAGFRRSGRILYQPICPTCRACRPIRFDTSAFRPDKRQRRILSRNADLTLTVGTPHLTEEKLALYQAYLTHQHHRPEPTSFDDLSSFLYTSPLADTVEIEYRRPDSRLVGVGICDVLPAVLSSVYFFWDPAERSRSLGTFAFLKEIELAQSLKKPWFHLGYWIENAPTMAYKASFADFEVLCSDGQWRPESRRSAQI